MNRLAMTLGFVFGAHGLWLAPSAFADENLDRLSTEVQSLKAGQEAIQKDLQEIKKLLAGLKAGRQPSRASITDLNKTLNISGAPSKGQVEARVTLVEFTDYQCPYCGRHLKTTMPQIEKNFVSTGKIRYVVRDYPLDFHQLAAKAHEAAHCASEQGKYWEMHDELFAQQKALQPDRLPEYAQSAGVADLTAFQACLDEGRFTEVTRKGITDGAAMGVRGTPSFVLGLSEPGGATIKAKKFIRGAQSYAVFEKAIKELLASVDG